jgi:hypothetical protein
MAVEFGSAETRWSANFKKFCVLADMEVITIDDLPVVNYGVWRGVNDAMRNILSELAQRSYERRQDLDYERDFDVYFCPKCTYAVRTTRLAVQRRGVPKCPLHGIDTVKFNRRTFFARERELFRRLESRLGSVLAVFAETAEAYAGRPPLEWRLRIPPPPRSGAQAQRRPHGL